MTEESANTYPLSAILNTAFPSSFTKSCSIVNGVLGRISPLLFSTEDQKNRNFAIDIRVRWN